MYSHLRPFPSSSIKVRRRHSFHLFFQHWISYSIFPFNSSARKVNGKKRQNSYDDRCLPDLFFLLPTSFWPLPPVFKRVTHYLLYKKEEKIRYEIILRAKKKKKKKMVNWTRMARWPRKNRVDSQLTVPFSAAA